ncbi:ABC transporter transmembrane region domain-containing protein [Ditylenchus destructor]|nr:ABC transporter transmembrane region domain-containing protein [Ditylenchus destructor]
MEALCHNSSGWIDPSYDPRNSNALPNLSECAQFTAMVWIPACFFWLLLPIFIAQVWRLRQTKCFKPLPNSSLLLTKFAITVILFLDAVFLCLKYFDDGNDLSLPSAVYLTYPLIRVVTMASIFLCMRAARQVGLVSSGILFNTWLLHMICAAPEIYGWYLRLISQNTTSQSEPFSVFRFVTSLVWFAGVAAQTILFAFADKRNDEERMKYTPEVNSSFLNCSLLWWCDPLIVRGAKKDLTIEDLFELNRGHRSEYLVPLWEKLWNPAVEVYNERKQALLTEGACSTLLSQAIHTIALRNESVFISDKRSPERNNRAGRKDKRTISPPSLAHTLFKLFKWELLSSAAIKMGADILQFVNPLLLRMLIDFVTDENAKLWQGVSYALLMFCTSQLKALMNTYYTIVTYRVGLKCQTVLTAATYKKTLRLSSAARRERTVGEIVNLMAIDIEKIQLTTVFMHNFWSCPFQITLALIFLYNTLGIAALPGVVMMTEQMKLKDERSKMINQILNGIKVIKLYAWEIPMMKTVETIREKELACILKAGLLGGIIETFNICAPFLVAICSFASFTLLNPSNSLTPQVAFVSMTLFNQTLTPMLYFAFFINQFVSCLVSNKRLKEFLVAEEISESAIDRTPEIGECLEVISVRDADFSWGSIPEMEKNGGTEIESSSPSCPVLNVQDVNLDVTKGSLLAVVGKVGTGKSSLLSALLGEMEKLRGYVGICGRVAYVPQSAWVRNATFRENITFGRAYDKKLYQKVVNACALQPDLDILPNGDETEIGEKGINLSGGQKARISLARAVYQNYDIYLLDDPLSAVDSHVGKHIFEQVIGPNGMLRNKTRILVTHGVGFLKEVDQIILLEDGRIVETGTFAELLAEKGKFTQLIEEGKIESSSISDSDSSPETDITEQKVVVRAVDDEDFEDNPEKDGAASSPVMDNGESDTRALLERQMSTVSAEGNIHQLLRTESQTAESGQSAIAKSQIRGTNENLIQKEKIETGQVKKTVYWDYIKSSGIFLCAAFFCLYCCFQALYVGRSVWLSKWADDNEMDMHNGSHAPSTSLGVRLGVYALFGFGEAITYYLSNLIGLFAGLSAMRNLHNPMLKRILQAPMVFFDTTPLGRILNRFSKDIELVDSVLGIHFRQFVRTVIQIVATLMIIIINLPIFLIVVFPITSQFGNRLRFAQSIYRSPIFSHFGETIQGSSSIRAFGRTEEFCVESERRVDTYLRIKYLSIVSNLWLMIRVEFIANIVILFTALFAALSKEWGWMQSAGLVGLTVSYALTITDVLNLGVRFISELETNIVSVERLKEYSEIETEADWKIDGKEPPKGWPNAGLLKFENYSTRYRPGLELALRNIHAEISPAENVGIVGRTGAGKSSLTLALFRMIEPVAGRIIIDGIDISKIGLHDLRSNLTIIPQDPVLFSGPLRFNLDPFSKHSDDDLWKALELAHLRTFVSSLPQLLDHPISEGGENISLGQRQLVCLARALLRRTKILVLDEATAAVDIYTDSLIQETIRKEFQESTVFTIAHRLNTIIDYNRVIVLQQGQIMEFDSPQRLLSTDSMFSKMAQDAKLREKE